MVEEEMPGQDGGGVEDEDREVINAIMETFRNFYTGTPTEAFARQLHRAMKNADLRREARQDERQVNRRNAAGDRVDNALPGSGGTPDNTLPSGGTPDNTLPSDGTVDNTLPETPSTKPGSPGRPSTQPVPPKPGTPPAKPGK